MIYWFNVEIEPVLLISNIWNWYPHYLFWFLCRPIEKSPKRNCRNLKKWKLSAKLSRPTEMRERSSACEGVQGGNWRRGGRPEARHSATGPWCWQRKTQINKVCQLIKKLRGVTSRDSERNASSPRCRGSHTLRKVARVIWGLILFSGQTGGSVSRCSRHFAGQARPRRREGCTGTQRNLIRRRHGDFRRNCFKLSRRVLQTRGPYFVVASLVFCELFWPRCRSLYPGQLWFNSIDNQF